MDWDRVNISDVLAMAAIVVGVPVLLFMSCNKEQPRKDYLVTPEGEARYQEVCINGHTYYSVISRNGHHGQIEAIAPRLDDAGKPVRCGK